MRRKKPSQARIKCRAGFKRSFTGSHSLTKCNPRRVLPREAREKPHRGRFQKNPYLVYTFISSVSLHGRPTKCPGTLILICRGFIERIHAISSVYCLGLPQLACLSMEFPLLVVSGKYILMLGLMCSTRPIGNLVLKKSVKLNPTSNFNFWHCTCFFHCPLVLGVCLAPPTTLYTSLTSYSLGRRLREASIFLHGFVTTCQVGQSLCWTSILLLLDLFPVYRDSCYSLYVDMCMKSSRWVRGICNEYVIKCLATTKCSFFCEVRQVLICHNDVSYV